MGAILFLIGIFIFCAILWALPLYLVVNFVFWIFHSTLHLSILQAFGLCLLSTIIHSMLFGKGGED